VCTRNTSCENGFFFNQARQQCQAGEIANCNEYQLNGAECSECAAGFEPSRFRDECEMK
jgi:hypothetical protein